MGDVVKLEDYKVGKSLEDDYLKFLPHVNKYLGIPSNTMDLTRCFYCILRYLEGSVNCYETMSLIYGETKEMEEMRQIVINWLDSISNDLKKY